MDLNLTYPLKTEVSANYNRGFISQSPSEGISIEKMEFIIPPVIARWHLQFGKESVELDSTNRFCFVGIFLHSPVWITKLELKNKQTNKKLFYFLVKICRPQKWSFSFFHFDPYIFIIYSHIFIKSLLFFIAFAQGKLCVLLNCWTN